MNVHFKESEYGLRQRLSYNDRDLSLRRFRELICPCMTLAKQRDTVDETVAEFKHCLLIWDVNMRYRIGMLKLLLRNVRTQDARSIRKIRQVQHFMHWRPNHHRIS